MKMYRKETLTIKLEKIFSRISEISCLQTENDSEECSGEYDDLLDEFIDLRLHMLDKRPVYEEAGGFDRSYALVDAINALTECG